jgi:hypothetical protein
MKPAPAGFSVPAPSMNRVSPEEEKQWLRKVSSVALSLRTAAEKEDGPDLKKAVMRAIELSAQLPEEFVDLAKILRMRKYAPKDEMVDEAFWTAQRLGQLVKDFNDGAYARASMASQESRLRENQQSAQKTWDGMSVTRRQSFLKNLRFDGTVAEMPFSKAKATIGRTSPEDALNFQDALDDLGMPTDPYDDD